MTQDIFHTTNNIFTSKIDPHLEAEAEEFFTLNGMEDFTKDDHFMIKDKTSTNIFAKRILRKNGTLKYMIRLSSNGKLFNPVSIYGQEQDKSFLDRVCRSNNKFVEVNSKTFDWYTKFLMIKI
jgi:DUF1365 family protein